MPKHQEKEKHQKQSASTPCPPADLQSDYDPFAEESTDYRGRGEKFEILPEGKNLDQSRFDQPRRNLESLPEAHKQKQPASQRHPSFEEERKKKREQKKRVA